MVTEAAIWAALEDVKDPEIPPVSIVDMGMVSRVIVEGPMHEPCGAEEGPADSQGRSSTVRVEITPTFVGCPALEIIRRSVERRLLAVGGVARATVGFVYDPPWSSDRITPQGRDRLRSFGIAPPPGGASRLCGVPGQCASAADVPAAAGLPLISLGEAPPCPYCGSADTHMENLFGPTACRAIFYCDACRQPFEGMKRI